MAGTLTDLGRIAAMQFVASQQIASRSARGAEITKPGQFFRDFAGGGGRTRTFEAMRRLIYSQLPLPLGTLPRFRVHREIARRLLADISPSMMLKTEKLQTASGRRVYGRCAMSKSTKGDGRGAKDFQSKWPS